MRDVAVIAFAQMAPVGAERTRDEIEMLLPVIAEAIERSGIARRDIGFTVSGSCDFLVGRPFSFVMALDPVGAWPPISESHVEMDGAWALYEAWVRLQHGDVDSALVYAFGRPSLGDPRDVLVMQLDPYVQTPLSPDPIAVAALQARAMIDAGGASERDLAAVAARALGAGGADVDALLDALLAAPYVASPLRAHDCSRICDGAAAIVLAAGDLARRVCRRPAWIRGIDHRIEPHSIGARDLTRSVSTELAARAAGATATDVHVDVAELHAPFTHQELLLRRALGLGDGVSINPSGGALAADPLMVTGLTRIGEAARRIHDGTARRVVAHATSGPCLQQNLVCVMEAAS
jgi:acetyl-CoA acetyltransferase